MIALMKREFRAQRYVALTAFAFTFALMWTAYADPTYEFTFLPLLQPGFMMVFATACFLTALGLGIWQLETEKVRGTEPFLMHRPVSRDKILTAKALSGLAMYTFITLIPFSVMLSKAQDHLFRWEMAYPEYVMFLSGIPIYLASLWMGTTLGQRRCEGVAAIITTFGAVCLNLGWLRLGWSELFLFIVCIFLFAGALGSYRSREL